MNLKYILIIIIIIVVLGGGFLVYQYGFKPSRESGVSGEPSQKGLTKDETANWETYRNEEYGFEIKYPKNWTTKEETKKNIDSIKEKYRLDIFHPENITEADIYGNVAIEFFVNEDNNSFFEKQLDLMRRDTTLTIEEITIDGIKGFKGTAYQEADKAQSMYISQIFADKENRGVFRILIWTIDLSNKTYQKQANLILSSFKFLK